MNGERKRCKAEDSIFDEPDYTRILKSRTRYAGSDAFGDRRAKYYLKSQPGTKKKKKLRGQPRDVPVTSCWV